MKTRFFSLFLLSLVFFSAVVVAQTFRGGIQGTVTDSSGAAIPGAEVTVKSAETGLVRTVTANDQGDYLVTDISRSLSRNA